MYNSILVALDGSDAARAALAEAIALARQVGGRLRLLHVVNGTPWTVSEVTGEALQQLIDGLRGTGESLLHEAITSARAAGVEADTRLIEAPGADAGEYVLKEASAWPADLVVCGTQGRRGVHRILMGSDAEYIVRHTPVPVLLVRAPAEAAHR
jgi:nucleotide-binding universal stress UspA family protein